MSSAVNVWKPNSKPQARALAVDIFELLYGGSRGGGKTDAGIVWVSIPACGPIAHPRYRGLVIRKNYEDLKDWIDRAKRFYEPYGATYNKSDKEFSFPSGAIIRLGHLKDDDAYGKYQGHEYHRMLLEELTQIPEEDQYLMLLASCRSTVPELSPSIFATANPGGAGHGWVKKRFISPSAPGVAFQDETTRLWRLFIPAKASDNPAIDKQYKQQLDGLPDKLRAAWRDGDWDILSGQYFTEFSRNAHVVRAGTQIKPNWTRYCGFDWGFAPDPWVCVWFAVDDRGNEWVYREAHGNNMIPSEVAKKLQKLSENDGQITLCHADPSCWSKKDGVDVAEKMIIAGWPMTMADNSRVHGWTRVHEYLMQEKIFIFDTCVNLIESIAEAQHDEKDPADVAPSKKDHWLDAMRYHLMSRPAPGRLPDNPPPRGSIAWFKKYGRKT